MQGPRPSVAGRARSALEALADRFGPYPWPSLNLAVVPDLDRVGIEYPTMIFLGENGIARTTTHEVAHQWFYSLVGNDQARDPVLDEGLATYSQAELDRIWPYLDGLPDPRAVRPLTGRPDVVLGGAARTRSTSSGSTPTARGCCTRSGIPRRSRAPCAGTSPRTPTGSRHRPISPVP